MLQCQPGKLPQHHKKKKKTAPAKVDAQSPHGYLLGLCESSTENAGSDQTGIPYTTLVRTLKEAGPREGLFNYLPTYSCDQGT